MAKQLNPNEREIIYLEIERLRIRREKSMLVLNKSLMLYFCFLLVGVVGFVFKYIDSFMLNILIILGIVILIAGSAPYLFTIHKEEKIIDKRLQELRGA
jgi:hypothetical protein